MSGGEARPILAGDMAIPDPAQFSRERVTTGLEVEAVFFLKSDTNRDRSSIENCIATPVSDWSMNSVSREIQTTEGDHLVRRPSVGSEPSVDSVRGQFR